MTAGRLEQILALIDAANAEDPRQDGSEGRLLPQELLYSQRMSACLADFEPAASEALQIAVRAQHIRRWQIPRDRYPMDRIGYLSWRRDLGQFHAEQSAALMEEAGWDKAGIARVRSLLTKQGIKRDAESQTLEDVACLVFLRYYLADFAARHPEEKLLAIIRKTWKKMSGHGHQAALQIELDSTLRALLAKAIALST